MNEKQLAYLLSFATDKADDLSRRITEKYANLLLLAEAPEAELFKLCDGDMTTIIYIKLIVSLASRRACERFKSKRRYTDAEIGEYLKALFFGLSTETVYLLSFDSTELLIAADRVGEGTVNTSSVLPRRILEVARKNHAAGVIVAHNHPGTSAQLSSDDVDAYRSLSELFELCGISFLGGYAVGGGEWEKIKFD